MSGVLEKLRRARATTAKAMTTAQSDLASVRAAIATAHNALQDLEGRPVAFDLAAAELDKKLAELSEDGVSSFQLHSLMGRDEGRIDWSPREGDYWTMARHVLAGGQALRDRLMDDLRRRYGEDKGLTPEERDAERDRLLSEAFHLECLEEAMIRAASEAGVRIERRANAHPAAILAPLHQLPEL